MNSNSGQKKEGKRHSTAFVSPSPGPFKIVRRVHGDLVEVALRSLLCHTQCQCGQLLVRAACDGALCAVELFQDVYPEVDSSDRYREVVRHHRILLWYRCDASENLSCFSACGSTSQEATAVTDGSNFTLSWVLHSYCGTRQWFTSLSTATGPSTTATKSSLSFCWLSGWAKSFFTFVEGGSNPRENHSGTMADVTEDAFLFRLSVQALCGVYVTSAITKHIMSRGRWFSHAEFFLTNLITVNERQYYNDGIQGSEWVTVWLADFLRHHRLIARGFFGSAFWLELLVPVFVYNRLWMTIGGFTLFFMHVWIAITMQLTFYSHLYALVAYMIDPVYWLSQLCERRTVQQLLQRFNVGFVNNLVKNYFCNTTNNKHTAEEGVDNVDVGSFDSQTASTIRQRAITVGWLTAVMLEISFQVDVAVGSHVLDYEGHFSVQSLPYVRGASSSRRLLLHLRQKQRPGLLFS